MKYAIISDVHGNYPALAAVLADAKKQRVDGYLLLGDYYCEMPWPNEVVDAVRALPHAHVVQGNKEGYLTELAKQDQETWIYEQFATLYWNYRSLRPDNMDYLMHLPDELLIKEADGTTFHLFHNPGYLFNGTLLEALSGKNYVLWRKTPLTHQNYIEHIRQRIDADRELLEKFSGIPKCVYLFGHTHVQWHLKIGKSLIINPGACGLPVDFNPTAPYTTLEYDNGTFRVEEHRVTYNVAQAIADYKRSSLYTSAKLWSDITIEQLWDAEGRTIFFLESLDAVADELGRTEQPYGNDVFHLAAERWFNR